MSETHQDIYIGGNVNSASPAFQVIQEIKDGSIPKNENVVESFKEMESALNAQASEKKGLESRFANDAHRLVKHTREIIEDKNSDDALRSMVLHIKEASDLLAESVPTDRIAAHGEAWLNHQSSQLQHLIDSFRSLILSLVRNSKLRNQMIDALQLLEQSFSDVLSTAVQKVEEKIETGAKRKIEQITGDEKSESNPNKVSKLEQGKGQPETKSLSSSQIREKLRGILIQVGTTPEYKEFINNVSTFFNTNWHYLSTLFAETAVENKTYTALVIVISDVQTLLERFSGNESLNSLRLRLGALLVSISRDQNIREFFGHWRDFLKKTIENPETQNVDSLDHELNDLLDSGKDLLKNGQFQEDIKVILKEFQGLIQRLREDSSFKTVGKDFDHMKKELLMGNEGKLDFLTLKNSVPTLKNVLIPTLTAALKNIPIPTITVDNEKYFLQLSNLSLAAQELIPEKIHINFTNDILFDFSPAGKDQFISRLTVVMRDFNALLQDINFKYDRKKIPQISDYGIADVEILGIDIDIKWKMEMKESSLSFHVDHVKCLIDSLNTNLKETTHQVLGNLYVTLFSGGMKRNLEQTIEEVIRDKVLEFSIDTKTPLSQQIGLPQA